MIRGNMARDPAKEGSGTQVWRKVYVTAELSVCLVCDGHLLKGTVRTAAVAADRSEVAWGRQRRWESCADRQVTDVHVRCRREAERRGGSGGWRHRKCGQTGGSGWGRTRSPGCFVTSDLAPLLKEDREQRTHFFIRIVRIFNVSD